MQGSKSEPGQVAAAIKAASVAQQVPVHAPVIPHGHEGEGENPVAQLLGGMKLKNADGSETAADPS
jgi:hypothetical protein